MTPLHDNLTRVVFACLPQATAKEAQASWRTAGRIAGAVVDELARMVRTQNTRKEG